MVCPNKGAVLRPLQAEMKVLLPLARMERKVLRAGSMNQRLKNMENKTIMDCLDNLRRLSETAGKELHEQVERVNEKTFFSDVFREAFKPLQ